MTLNRFAVGALLRATAAAHAQADINEIVVCDNLSDADRWMMEGYLAHKWGLEGDLPVAHPYKSSPPPAPDPWISGYRYRKSQVIDAGSGAGTGYQIEVKVGEADGASDYDLHVEGKAQGFPNDVRFTDDDGGTQLDHWLESISGTTPNRTATYWVKVKDNLDSAQSIYVYYGKSGETSASDGDATFGFFDDFPGASIDTAKWTITDGTGWSVGGSELLGQNTSGRLTSKSMFGSGVILETKYRTVNRPSNGNMVFGFYVSSTDNFGWLNHPGGDYMRVNGGWSGIGNECNLPVIGRIVTRATQVDFYVYRQDNGVLWHNRPNQNSTVNNEPIVLGRRYDNALTGQGYNAYWDWVRVRKYAATAPALGAAGREEDYFGVTPTNQDASGITTDSATFNATLEAPNTNASVYVHWGTTDGTTNASAWDHSAYVGSWTNVASTNISFSTNGFSAGSLYYYTFRSTNDSTNFWASPSAAFGTLGKPSVDNAGGPTPGFGTATLQGRVVSTGGVALTHVRIYFGDEDGGATHNWDSNYVFDVGSVTQGVAFSTNVSGLIYGIEYAYRTYASNANGEAWSAPSTFGTSVPEMPQMPNAELTADGQTFDAYFEDHDGEIWLLIGRGRQGWQFDTDGQGSADDVSRDLRTAAAFSPVCYSDAIVNDLLTQAGQTMSTVEMRLSRATTTDGLGVYQDVRWRDFGSHGTAGNAFTWDIENNNANRYNITMEWKNDPDGGGGNFYTGTTTGNTRDIGPNNGNRVFTWAWSGHGSQMGFSYGTSITAGYNDPNTFLWENGTENHSIPYTEVYIPFDPPMIPAVGIENTGATNVGMTSADLLGTLDGTGSVFDVIVYWGTNDNAGAAWLSDGTASKMTLGTYTNVTGQSLTGSVSLLTSGTIYYYTMMASNEITTIWAASNVIFGTDGPPTLVNDGFTSHIGYATLSGNVITTGGLPVSVRMYWGDTDGGTNAANWANTNIFSGTRGTGTFSTNTTGGLTYGALYYYRCWASNANGVGWAPKTSGFWTAMPMTDPYAAGLVSGTLSGNIDTTTPNPANGDGNGVVNMGPWRATQSIFFVWYTT